MVVGFSLGGSHVEAQVYYLPLFALLLIFHVLYLVQGNKSVIRVSTAPLLFLPFIVWAWISVVLITPKPLNGWHEFLYALEAFIFFWVITNNLKKRKQFSLLLVCGIFPVVAALIIAFYQFFQKPHFALSFLQDAPMVLHPDVVGRATGVFTDPESFGMLILMTIPLVFVVTAVPRLPGIIRLLGFYAMVALFIGLVLSQTLWVLLVALVGCGTAVIFCYETRKSRIVVSLLTIGGAVLIMGLLIGSFNSISQNLTDAVSVTGEGARLAIWGQTIGIILDNPIFGAGAGSFVQEYEQGSVYGLNRIPLSPSSDLLLLLTEYGLVGLVLLLVPAFMIVSRAFQRWVEEPSRVRLQFVKKKVMPLQRFYLTIALGAVFASFECFVLGRVWATPLLLLYNAIVFATLVRSAKGSFIEINKTAFAEAVLLISVFAGALFMVFFFKPRMQSAGLSEDAWEALERNLRLDMETPVESSSDTVLSEDFNKAYTLYAKNDDALLGLCLTELKKYDSNPSEHTKIGKAVASHAQKAIQLNMSNWRGWAYLGLAESIQGDALAAEHAFQEALARAPYSSNANYYYAALLAQMPGQRSAAIEAVNQALQINPANKAALRLKQKLLIQ
jgi:O-antigen ligase